jgi:hypothetical protein
MNTATLNAAHMNHGGGLTPGQPQSQSQHPSAETPDENDLRSRWKKARDEIQKDIANNPTELGRIISYVKFAYAVARIVMEIAFSLLRYLFQKLMQVFGFHKTDNKKNTAKQPQDSTDKAPGDLSLTTVDAKGAELTTADTSLQDAEQETEHEIIDKVSSDESAYETAEYVDIIEGLATLMPECRDELLALNQPHKIIPRYHELDPQLQYYASKMYNGLKQATIDCIVDESMSKPNANETEQTLKEKLKHDVLIAVDKLLISEKEKLLQILIQAEASDPLVLNEEMIASLEQFIDLLPDTDPSILNDLNRHNRLMKICQENQSIVEKITAHKGIKASIDKFLQNESQKQDVVIAPKLLFLGRHSNQANANEEGLDHEDADHKEAGTPHNKEGDAHDESEKDNDNPNSSVPREKNR